MTNDEARARVARGAALLDAKRPGWADRINVGTLDIACTECVLFQLSVAYELAGGVGSYSAMLLDIAGLADGADLGFFVPWNETSETENPSWDRLTHAWIEAITERLTPPVAWTMRDSVAAVGVERCELAGPVVP